MRFPFLNLNTKATLSFQLSFRDVYHAKASNVFLRTLKVAEVSLRETGIGTSKRHG
jgi:hypothetical protein